jgi:hypothetical protein
MSQLILNLDDPSLQTGLNLIAQTEGKEVQEVIMNAIQHWVKQQSSPPLKKLDPFRHSVPIRYEVGEDLNEVIPFADVTDSAQFGQELRRQLWERTNHAQ